MQDIDEEKVINQGFAIFDANGDGQISIDDLRTITRSLGEELSEEELHEIIKDIDTNGDDMIDFTEFSELVRVKEQSEL